MFLILHVRGLHQHSTHQRVPRGPWRHAIESTTTLPTRQSRGDDADDPKHLASSFLSFNTKAPQQPPRYSSDDDVSRPNNATWGRQTRYTSRPHRGVRDSAFALIVTPLQHLAKCFLLRPQPPPPRTPLQLALERGVFTAESLKFYRSIFRSQTHCIPKGITQLDRQVPRRGAQSLPKLDRRRLRVQSTLERPILDGLSKKLKGNLLREWTNGISNGINQLNRQGPHLRLQKSPKFERRCLRLQSTLERPIRLQSL